MKIALDVRSLETGNKYRGIGYYIYSIVDNIVRIESDNSYLLFAYSKSNPLYEELKNIKDVRFCFIPKLNLKPRIFWWFDNIGLLYLLLKHRPNLFHSLDYNPPLIKFYPTVLTVHDMIPYIFSEQYLKPFDKKCELSIKYKLAKKSNAIITDSDYSKNDIVKLLKYPEDKIYSIYLAVDRPQPITQAEKVCIKNKYSGGSGYVMYMGDMYGYDFRKKVGWLIEAFAKIVSRNKNFKLKLLLVGNNGGVNNDYERLTKLIKKNNLQQKVIFTGYLENDEMIRVLQTAKLFVYPSVYEGFGLPPLQAMAANVPVVSFSNSSITEIAADAALLVEENVDGLAVGMEKVLFNEKRRDDMIEKGLKLAKRFSWEKVARQTIDVYHNIGSR